MSAPYLARMIPRMTQSIMEMVELWTLSSERLRNKDSSEQAFSATDDIRLASIDVIASITFGASFNSIRNALELLESDHQAAASKRPPTPALAHALEQLLETISDGMLFPFPSLFTWWTRTFDTKWDRAHKLLFKFLETKLGQAREAHEMLGHSDKQPQARLADNVLDMILEKEREDLLKGEEALTHQEILDELATYALAGSESKQPVIIFHRTNQLLTCSSFQRQRQQFNGRSKSWPGIQKSSEDFIGRSWINCQLRDIARQPMKSFRATKGCLTSLPSCTRFCGLPRRRPQSREM
jgi:hypothetical protein